MVSFHLCTAAATPPPPVLLLLLPPPPPSPNASSNTATAKYFCYLVNFFILPQLVFASVPCLL